MTCLCPIARMTAPTMTRKSLTRLAAEITAATGADPALDRHLAEVLHDDPDAEGPHDYSGSVDACLRLIARVAPDWHWHVGHGPDGILPYAALSKGEANDRRFESAAPTVPLALLGALLQALIAERR